MKAALESADLDALLDHCLELIESGDVEGVSAVMAANPASAGVLARRLALLADTGLLPTSDAAEHPPETLGPFQLRGRLGAGAMGVVWRAWQDPPGREVALKVVRPESLLFPESRARFRREVELAARLSHPSILPILAVGEDRGLPWFATELVAGESLAELVARVAERFGAPSAVDMEQVSRDFAERAGRPHTIWRSGDGTPHGSWTRFALHVARDLARALAHAHSRGVLHRDVKPQNALIGADGRVWLADFGLATGADDASLTSTRSQVGSLPYMAPEVLSGAPPDVRSDVYGLGALLYELALLRRPFVQAQSPALVAAILAGEPTPPRALDPKLPADAAAVIECAIARDAGARYANAEAFADDLDALLAGRPTSARPRTFVQRVVLAARRRPALAASAVLAFLVVVVAPVTFALQSRAATRAIAAERDRTIAAERARTRAAEESAASIALERDRAHTAHQHAMDAVERMLSRLGGDLAYVPAMESVRERIFGDAIELLERVSKERAAAGEPAAELDLARALFRSASLHHLLGRHELAAAALREARVHAARVVDVATADGDDALLARAAASESEFAIEEVRGLILANDLQGAERRAAAAQERLESHADVLTASHHFVLSHALANAGGLAVARQGREEGVGRMRAAAEALYARLAEAPVSPDQLENTFVACHSYAGEVLRAIGDRPPADHVVDALERAVRLAEMRVARVAEPSRYRDLISTRVNLAGAHLRRDEFDAAEVIYLAAREQAARLAADHPSTLTFRLEHAGALNQLGLIAESRRDPHTAFEYFSEVAEVLEDLCRAVPDSATFRQRLALAYLNASSPLRAQRDVEGAEAWVEQALAAIEEARRLAPDEAGFRDTLLTALGARWLLRRDAGDHGGLAVAADRLAAVDVPDPHRRAALHRAAFAYVNAFELAERSGADADTVGRYVERACDLTRRSFEAGNRYPDARLLQNLRPLHGRPEFEALAAWIDAQHGRAAE